MARDGSRVSTLDLLGGQQFTLLAGPEGRAWCDAARAAADRLRVPLDALVISADEQPAGGDADWTATYGIQDDGAVLIRPDGYVGWRRASVSSDPSLELTGALEHILGRAQQSTI